MTTQPATLDIPAASQHWCILTPEDLAEMERILGRKLTLEERRLLSLAARVQPIRFRRRAEDKVERSVAKKNSAAGGE